MTAFHTIAIPHDDILQGCLTMDVFTAPTCGRYSQGRTGCGSKITVEVLQ
jgi:hypothetical protein